MNKNIVVINVLNQTKDKIENLIKDYYSQINSVYIEVPYNEDEKLILDHY